MRCPSKLKNGMSPAYYRPREPSWPRRPRGSASFETRRLQTVQSIQEEPMAKQPRILAGETAAITGAARGIGRATAEAFLAHGMKVAIGDVDIEAARRTATELGA